MSASIALPAGRPSWFATVSARLADLADQVTTARYGAPPPEGEEIEPMDPEEARLYVAMACAVHF